MTYLPCEFCCSEHRKGKANNKEEACRYPLTKPERRTRYLHVGKVWDQYRRLHGMLLADGLRVAFRGAFHMPILAIYHT